MNPQVPTNPDQDNPTTAVPVTDNSVRTDPLAPAETTPSTDAAAPSLQEIEAIESEGSTTPTPVPATDASAAAQGGAEPATTAFTAQPQVTATPSPVPAVESPVVDTAPTATPVETPTDPATAAPAAPAAPVVSSAKKPVSKPVLIALGAVVVIAIVVIVVVVLL